MERAGSIRRPIIPAAFGSWVRGCAIIVFLVLPVLLVPANRVAAQDLATDYERAAGYYSRRRWSEAEQAFARLVEQYPNARRSQLAGFFLAEARMQQRKFRQAQPAFEIYLSRQGSGEYAARAMFRLGEIAYRIGDAEAAIRWLERFNQEYPGHALQEFALPYLGQVRIGRDEPQLAQLAFEAALRQYPTGTLQLESKLGLAQALHRRGDVDEAIRFYDVVIRQGSADLAAEAHLQRGTLAFEQQQWEQANHQLAEALRISSRDELRAKAALWLARIDRNQQQNEDALNHVLPWIEADLTDDLATSLLLEAAAAAIDADRGHLAHPWLDRLQRDFPNSPHRDRAIRLQISLYQRQGETDRAIELARQSGLMQLLPELTADQQSQRGQQQYRDGDYVAAAKTFDQLLTGHVSGVGDQLQWRFYKSLALLGQSDFGQAERELSQIDTDDLEPEFRDQVLLARANASLGLERYREAARDYERCLGESNTLQEEVRLPASFEWVLCLARSGQLESAVGKLDEIWAWPEQGASESSRKVLDVWEANTLAAVAKAAAGGAREDLARRCWKVLAERSNDPELQANAILQLAGVSGGVASENQSEAPLTATWEQALAAGTVSPAQVRAIMIHARQLQTDHPDQAADWWRQLCTSVEIPGVRDQARLSLARLLQQRGRPADLEEARQSLELIRESDAQPLEKNRDEVEYRLGWIAIDQGDRDRATACFERLLEKYPDSPHWEDAAYRIASDCMTDQRWDQAERAIQRLLDREDLTSEIHARAMFLSGQLGIARKDWARVADSMRKVSNLAVDATLKLESQYWLGEALYRSAQYSAAVEQLQPLADHSQLTVERRGWVQLRLAQSAAESGQWDEAGRLAREGIEKYPASVHCREWEFLNGRALEVEGRLTDARSAFQRVVDADQGQRSELAAQAEWRIGETQFHQEHYAAAIQGYYRVESLYDFPQWQSASLLQAGKCQELLNNPINAGKLYRQLLKRYPDSEFAEEARRRMGRLSRVSNRATSPAASRQ